MKPHSPATTRHEARARVFSLCSKRRRRTYLSSTGVLLTLPPIPFLRFLLINHTFRTRLLEQTSYIGVC